MIENVMLLLKGTLSGRSVSDLLPLCHPLGMFKESTMRSIPTFEPNAKGYADLYQTVLIDTPIGPYFEAFLAESSQSLGTAGEIRNILEETELVLIQSSVTKFWLESFNA
jgi:V-type H+-transporting ATPase subunit d